MVVMDLKPFSELLLEEDQPQLQHQLLLQHAHPQIVDAKHVEEDPAKIRELKKLNILPKKLSTELFKN